MATRCSYLYGGCHAGHRVKKTIITVCDEVFFTAIGARLFVWLYFKIHAADEIWIF